MKKTCLPCFQESVKVILFRVELVHTPYFMDLIIHKYRNFRENNALCAHRRRLWTLSRRSLRNLLVCNRMSLNSHILNWGKTL